MVIINLIKILAIIVPLLISVAYFTVAERKILGAIQIRGYWGGGFLWKFGFLMILFLMFCWSRDIVREGTLESPVQIIFQSPGENLDVMSSNILFSVQEPILLVSTAALKYGLIVGGSAGILALGFYWWFYGFNGGTGGTGGTEAVSTISVSQETSSAITITTTGNEGDIAMAAAQAVTDTQVLSVKALLGEKASSVIGSFDGFMIGTAEAAVGGHGDAEVLANSKDFHRYVVGYIDGYNTGCAGMDSANVIMMASNYRDGYAAGYCEGDDTFLGRVTSVSENTADLFGYLHGYNCNSNLNGAPEISYETYMSIIKPVPIETVASVNSPVDLATSIPENVPSYFFEFVSKVGDFISSFFPPGV